MAVSFTTIPAGDLGAGTSEEQSPAPPPSSRKVPKKNIVGNVYGMLRVISYVGVSGSAGKFLCLCECGQEKIFPGKDLRREKRKSCGTCYRKKFGGPTPYRDGKHSTISQVYREYANSAKKRGLEFSISMEEFEVLIFSCCSYCGIPPSTIKNKYVKKDGSPASNTRGKEIRPERIAQATLAYNGVDRIDNAIGYTSDNCVTACKQCNLAKYTYSKEQFLVWAERVVKFNGGFFQHNKRA